LRSALALGRVGVGLRPELAADLLADPDRVDFVEVVAETCFAQARARREAEALRALWPVVPHGVKLSLGSAEGIEAERARRLGELARRLGAPCITEHVAFTRGGGQEIGHLTQLPRTREAVRVVARNVACARRHLPDVPLLLENVAWTVRWPEDEMDEGTFYAEIVEATGCDLLLDLGNVYANARNEGVAPAAALARYPIERVGMVHIAGGVDECGFYFDDHASPVPVAVFGLLEMLLARVGPIPVLLERDGSFPPFSELAGEIARARAISEAAPPGAAAIDIGTRAAPAGVAPRAAAPRPDAPEPSGGDDARAAALAAEQARLAVWLTAPAAPGVEAARRYGAAALERARGVLQRKRVDDALPLLPRIGRHREALFGLAEAAVAEAARPPSGAGPADAWRIVEAACRDARFGDDARLDRLLLRARFVGPDDAGRLRARRGPFVGRERVAGGRSLWAVKGVGLDAVVRVFGGARSRAMAGSCAEARRAGSAVHGAEGSCAEARRAGSVVHGAEGSCAEAQGR
jgi:uncharacterized protein (UPF0276 family)